MMSTPPERSGRSPLRRGSHGNAGRRFIDVPFGGTSALDQRRWPARIAKIGEQRPDDMRLVYPSDQEHYAPCCIDHVEGQSDAVARLGTFRGLCVHSPTPFLRDGLAAGKE